MEYPIWHLTTFAGGFWVAFIATVHVFIAQFAVGGGLFLVLTEHYGHAKNSPAILGFVKKHARFFLLLSMVLGAVTGVGIWFSIALLSPQGTIILIHNFVFGWATEWVFFLTEIVSILVYYYAWDRLSKKNHLIVGWLYFVSAWLSLVLITGIIGFMLTPGKWMETRNFWDGFFNPTFWPQVAFRTAIALTIAGLFGFLTATRLKDDQARTSMVRLCSLWTILPFALTILFGWWYLSALPEPQATLIMAKSQRVALGMHWFWILAPATVIGGLIMAVKLPSRVSFPLALVVLLVGFGFMGSFEFMREAGRKPYVIHGLLYSNSVDPAQVATMNQNGAIATAKWADKSLDLNVNPDADPLAVGEELFQMQCAACHSIGGPINDILPRTAKFGHIGMDAMLNGLGKVNQYMPPFAGTLPERRALTAYIVEGLHQKGDTSEPTFTNEELQEGVAMPEIPAFNPAPPEQGGSQYVLLAWNNLGMHCISDSDQNWILLPPANDIFAQLIKRDFIPEIVTEGVEFSYAVEEPNRNPAAHVEFWKHAQALFGLEGPLPENIGVGGFGVVGTMHLDEATGIGEAKLVPVVPYPDNKDYNPFPIFTVTAKDTASGEVLGETHIVAPTATEMGCKNCHGGDWKVPGKAGIGPETGRDVIATHDRMNGTDLVARAEAGKPVLCQSCHPDPVLGSEGDMANYPGLLNLPAALHGLHAQYLTDRGAEACAYCHPNREGGPTRCLRGLHAQVVDCTSCHGFLEDHAASLLKAEQLKDKPRADALLATIQTRAVGSIEEVNPRVPWLQEPDCLNCHVDFQNPGTDAYNTWTEGAPGLFRIRMDELGTLPCIGCHNSPHATWPTDNRYGADRDNIPPLQYMGVAGSMGTQGNCVCHTEEMDFSAHHPNMIRP